jgi:hypothetical protein
MGSGRETTTSIALFRVFSFIQNQTRQSSIAAISRLAAMVVIAGERAKNIKTGGLKKC